MQYNQDPIQIRKAGIKEAFAAAQEIPEFQQSYPIEEYYERLGQSPNLILVAEIDQTLAGFKVAYDRNGAFYSWMGGVVPEFRRRGVAKILADHQENWARKVGYTSVSFKTWNQHKGMLIFSLKNGFNIVKVEKRDRIEDYRIILKKNL